MATTLIELIKHFDELPDNMLVGPPVAATVLNISERKLRRDSSIARVEISERKRGYRVGTLREIIRGKIPATA